MASAVPPLPTEPLRSARLDAPQPSPTFDEDYDLVIKRSEFGNEQGKVAICKDEEQRTKLYAKPRSAVVLAGTQVMKGPKLEAWKDAVWAGAAALFEQESTLRIHHVGMPLEHVVCLGQIAIIYSSFLFNFFHESTLSLVFHVD